MAKSLLKWRLSVKHYRDMMNELEKYCLKEIDAIEEGTFMYQLYECAFFDKIKFQKFILSVRELTNYYIKNGKTKYYETIVSGIVDRFLYIMLMFYCHLDSDDLYLIENYHDIKEDIPEYFNDMRMVTNDLITITNSKPTE